MKDVELGPHICLGIKEGFGMAGSKKGTEGTVTGLKSSQKKQQR
jgi:hypothetical protein